MLSDWILITEEMASHVFVDDGHFRRSYSVTIGEVTPGQNPHSHGLKESGSDQVNRRPRILPGRRYVARDLYVAPFEDVAIEEAVHRGTCRKHARQGGDPPLDNLKEGGHGLPN